MRITKQKRTILQILKENRCHPTALEIYELAKEILPDISLSTIYRTLKEMVEKGEIMELHLEGETKARYDINHDNHAHFKCRDCGKIFDIEIMFPLKLVGFRVERMDIHMYGLCHGCAKKEVKA